jgi:hypothetical protein
MEPLGGYAEGEWDPDDTAELADGLTGAVMAGSSGGLEAYRRERMDVLRRLKSRRVTPKGMDRDLERLSWTRPETDTERVSAVRCVIYVHGVIPDYY